MIEELRYQLTHMVARTPLPAGFVYRFAADFVLKHGQATEPRPWRQHWWTGARNMCFGNAIMMGVRHGWRYVEGFALHPWNKAPVPLAHAWNLADDGGLVDTTWQNAGVAYLGVTFALGRADDATWHGDASILDDFRRGHPLFRQRWPGEDWQKVWQPSAALLAALAQRR